MTKVLVLGSKGMLGYAVSTYFRHQGQDVVSLSRSEYDIAKDPFEKLTGFVNGVGAIINCAGVIKPMIASTSAEDVLKVNGIFPRNLSKLCSRNGIQCFHITTDCVFSGKKGKYDENDVFDAEDIYGMSKNVGEWPESMVLRTSIIGEEIGQKRSLLEWAKLQKGKEVSGFTNHFWNGLTTTYLAFVILTMLNRNLYRPGVFHIYSPNIVTKFELLKIIDEVYDLGMRIKAVAAAQHCDRSLGSTKSLSKDLVTDDIRSQVRQMKILFEKMNPPK